MPPHNQRRKHTRNFQRKADGSFWKLKSNKKFRPESRPKSGTTLRSTEVGLFGGSRARRGRAEQTFEVERLYAKRWVHSLEFYLVQWVGYRELTWEPSKNIPWRLKVDFEIETISFVWLYQPTRGRRRSTKNPTRRSSRILRGA